MKTTDPLVQGVRDEIEAPDEPGERNQDLEAFNPVALMPHDVPPSKAARWRKLSRLAATQPRAAIELKCLDCCGWERTEAARCQITSCALWASNRRIFG